MVFCLSKKTSGGTRGETHMVVCSKRHGEPMTEGRGNGRQSIVNAGETNGGTRSMDGEAIANSRGKYEGTLRESMGNNCGGGGGLHRYTEGTRNSR